MILFTIEYNYLRGEIMRKIILWQIIGFITTSIFGILLHFLYDWTDSKWLAIFSSINESTWEHMKIMFWPMFIFAIIQSFFLQNNNFWVVKLKGILLALILIPTIFYTYTGVIGRSFDWFNITIFFISAATAYIYETKQLKKDINAKKAPFIAIIILFLIATLFIIFTFNTPEINIFK